VLIKAGAGAERHLRQPLINQPTMNAITFRQAWDYGGFLMWVLAGLSVLAFAVLPCGIQGIP
jgi:hypothetical protein